MIQFIDSEFVLTFFGTPGTITNSDSRCQTVP